MLLDLDQLRALALLKRRQTELIEARDRFLAVEAEAHQLGVSHRQIAAVTGDKAHTVYRRLTGKNTRETIL